MTIILEFESAEQFDTWYNSPEYQAIINLRLHSTNNAIAVIADQFVMPA